MKRVLLSIVAICLLAGPVSAGLYTLDATTAAELRMTELTDDGDLQWVGYNDGTIVGDKVWGTAVRYGDVMQLDVGFRGTLEEFEDDGDSLASMRIGAAGTSALATIKAQSGSFDRFSLAVANDNDDTWSYGLYVITDDGSYVTPDASFVTLTKDTQTALTLAFGNDVDFSSVQDLGFIIRGDFSGTGPSNPDYFHTSISAVPVPVGIVLGVLGLGVAGLKLRKFV